MPIKTELKAIRSHKGINQKDIATKIGCSHRQFRRYENGETPVPFKHASAWAKALGITITAFEKIY
jgi:transcriptional regulator with XRE-family HTH domain